MLTTWLHISLCLIEVAELTSQPAPQASTDRHFDPLPRKAFDIPMASDPTSTHPTTDLDADPLPDHSLHHPTSSDQTSPHTTDHNSDPLPHGLQDDEDDDVLVELTNHAQEALPMECPFTFLSLSSEDSSRDSNELADITTTDSIPEEFGKQGTTHIPVTATQVLSSSSGDERRKWIAAAKQELDNLGTLHAQSKLCHHRRRKRSNLRLGQRVRSTLSFPLRASFQSNLTSTKSE